MHQQTSDPIFPKKGKEKEIFDFKAAQSDIVNPYIYVLPPILLLLILAALDYYLLNKGFSSSWNAIFYGSTIVSIMTIYVFQYQLRTAKKRKEMATSTISSAVNGEVELLGKIHAIDGSKISPFFGIECLAFKSSIEAKCKRGGRQNSWITLGEFSDEKFDGFYLADDTGTAFTSGLSQLPFELTLAESGLSKKENLSVIDNLKIKYYDMPEKLEQLIELSKALEHEMDDNALINGMRRMRVAFSEEVLVNDCSVMLTGQITGIPLENNDISLDGLRNFFSALPDGDRNFENVDREIGKLQNFIKLNNNSSDIARILTPLKYEPQIIMSTTFLKEDENLRNIAITSLVTILVCVVGISLSYSM